MLLQHVDLLMWPHKTPNPWILLSMNSVQCEHSQLEEPSWRFFTTIGLWVDFSN